MSKDYDPTNPNELRRRQEERLARYEQRHGEIIDLLLEADLLKQDARTDALIREYQDLEVRIEQLEYELYSDKKQPFNY